jgi:hypothetical protein
LEKGAKEEERHKRWLTQQKILGKKFGSLCGSAEEQRENKLKQKDPGFAPQPSLGNLFNIG